MRRLAARTTAAHQRRILHPADEARPWREFARAGDAPPSDGASAVVPLVAGPFPAVRWHAAVGWPWSRLFGRPRRLAVAWTVRTGRWFEARFHIHAAWNVGLYPSLLFIERDYRGGVYHGGVWSTLYSADVRDLRRAMLLWRRPPIKQRLTHSAAGA